MHLSRRQLFAASLLAIPFLDEASAQAPIAMHPVDETKLPPVPPDEPIEGAVFLAGGPMLGHIDHERALLWVKASNAAKPSVRISTKADLSDARVVNGSALTADTAFAGTIEIPDLAPATRYYYAVLLDGDVVTLRPAASFITGPAPGTAGKQRIAFVSCVGLRAFHVAASWGEMDVRSNFDLLLQLGDNHYANTSKIEKQRAYYRMHRAIPAYRSLTSRIPCLAIWDDHDFGPNNSDGTLEGKENSLRVFKEQWANPSYGTADVPGCFFKITRGDVDIFFLDVRYHRSPDKAPMDPAKTMLGAGQLAWLKAELKASKAKFKFVASGSVFDSKGSDDSWAIYPHERRILLDFLRDEIGDGVVLISGDRHFTAAYQIEGRFVEVTSGPLGSGNATATQTEELWLACNTGRMWSIFEVDTTGAEPKLTYELWMAGVGLVEVRELTWEQVNGRAKIPPSPPLPRMSVPRKPAPAKVEPAKVEAAQ